MATTTTAPTTNGRRADGRARPARARGVGRRRQLPLVVVGVLLVLGCALAFADASLHLGSREEVLVLAQPVAAGQVLSAGDLRSARVSTGSSLAVVPVAAERSVVGRRAAVALVAGALLTTSEVGAVPPVAAGFDEVAVGLKPGAYPPDVAPGDRVQVVPVASSSASSTAGATGGSPVAATVLAVDAAPADTSNPTVVSLQVATRDAVEVALLAAAGQASVIEVGG